MMTATEPLFLYPQSRQFPFDEVCEHIVRALEERNWEIPGMTVDFDVYGTGASKYRLVRTIRSEEFKLHFGRPQARLGTYNDTAAITEIVIPQRELHVYDEESGPTYYTYVGNDWEQDKSEWYTAWRVNSKLKGLPRTYLRYTGGCDCRSTAGASFDAMEFFGAWLSRDAEAAANMRHTHPGRRSPMLVADNDLNREHEPEGDEPWSYRTDKVFAEFTQWLKDNVLAHILAQPIADERIDIFREKTTPFPDGIGEIFCFGDYRVARRVYQGNLDGTSLNPDDRYGILPNWRLVTLGEGLDDDVDHMLATDGFIWCAFGNVTSDTPRETLSVPGQRMITGDEKFVFRIKPKRADGIYVADNAPYEQRREELSAAIPDERRDFTREEMQDFVSARARTLVPIAEYNGSYQQPMVLINRELELDEVELVSGPWPECQYVRLIANYSDETRDYLEMALRAIDMQHSSVLGDDYKRALQRYDNIVKALADYTLDVWQIFDGLEHLQSLRYMNPSNHQKMVRIVVDAAYEMRKLGLY